MVDLVQFAQVANQVGVLANVARRYVAPQEVEDAFDASVERCERMVDTHVLQSTLSPRSVMRNFKPSRPYGTTHTSGKRFPYAPSAIHWRSPIGDWRLASASPVSLPPLGG